MSANKLFCIRIRGQHSFDCFGHKPAKRLQTLARPRRSLSSPLFSLDPPTLFLPCSPPSDSNPRTETFALIGTADSDSG